MIIEILNSSLIVTFILVVWFKSNAFCEYMEFLRLSNHFLINDYFKERKKIVSSLHYTDYILLKKNCFFIRLITCPLCLGIWLNISLGLIINFDNFFLKFYIASSLYYLYCILIKYCYND